MTDLQGKDADWWANFLLGRGDGGCRNAAKMFIRSSGVERKGGMFYWDYAPQGFEYWAALHEESPHLEEAKSFVRWLLRGNIKDDSEET